MSFKVRTTLCLALLFFCAGHSRAQDEVARQVLPAKQGGKVVSSAVMDDIYEQIKTPFKCRISVATLRDMKLTR
ncbi:MAG: hypothetical protein PHO37_12350 [Kiritimatiellae bacterium]|nr:hypothetical protein [Kiritimatiellia bacterium]